MIWELDHKEGWALKNWCFWTGVLEKALQSPLDCKEIKPVHPKGNQSWVFIRGNDAESEAQILWPQNPDSGKDWRQDEKWMAEDEMIGWHQWLNGQEFVQTLGDSGGWRSLVYCSPRARKESDTTERLNNNGKDSGTPPCLSQFSLWTGYYCPDFTDEIGWNSGLRGQVIF